MTTKTKIFIAIGTLGVISLAVFINYRSRKIKRIGKSFEGVAEIGDNAGFSDETLQQMLKESGWKGGEAWCMYYAKAIYKKAVPKLADKIQKQLTGSTQGSWNDAVQGKLENFEAITSGRPKIGDIVIWQRISDSGKGHAGIVVKTNAKKYANGFTSVEGNTNYDPSFKGEGDLVDTIEHNLNYGEVDKIYKNLRLKGFLRLK
jgi:hypothetical protein